ncbi:MAG: hypothetical protein AAGK74_02695 [Chloroflexota bacterium]
MTFNNNDDFDDFDFDDDDFGLDDDFDLAGDDSGAGFDDFGDFDDFEDSAGADDFGDDFGFGDDEFSDTNFDDVELGLDDGEDLVLDEFEEEPRENSGFRRALAVLGGVLALQLVIILLLFFLSPGGDGGLSITQTVESIEMTNVALISQATNEAGTAQAVGTITAEFLSRTPTPTPTATNTRPPTFTPSPTEEAPPTLDPTFEFLTQVAEETADAASVLQQTEDAGATLTADAGGAALDVQGTATAIFSSFLTATALAEERGTGTPMDIVTQPAGEITPTATALPTSGFFDEGPTSGNLGLFALAAFGLLGVIAFTRRLRMNEENA